MVNPGRRHCPAVRRLDATQLHARRFGTGEPNSLQAPRRGQTKTTAAKDISDESLILTPMGFRPPSMGSRSRPRHRPAPRLTRPERSGASHPRNLPQKMSYGKSVRGSDDFVAGARVFERVTGKGDGKGAAGAGGQAPGRQRTARRPRPEHAKRRAPVAPPSRAPLRPTGPRPRRRVRSRFVQGHSEPLASSVCSVYVVQHLSKE